MKWQQWDWTASPGLLKVNLYFKIFDIKCHFCLKMRIEEIGPKNKFQHVQSCSGPKEQFKTVHHQSKCPSKTQCPLYSSKGNIVVWDFWFPSVHHKKEKPKRLVIFPTIDRSDWQNNYSYKDNWRQDKTRIYHNSARRSKNGRRRGCFHFIFNYGFVTMIVIFSAEEFNHKQSNRDLTINSKGNRNFCDVCSGGQHFTAWV